MSRASNSLFCIAEVDIACSLQRDDVKYSQHHHKVFSGLRIGNGEEFCLRVEPKRKDDDLEERERSLVR